MSGYDSQYNRSDAGTLLRKAAELINDAITWDMTEEGKSYWVLVYETLFDKAYKADNYFGHAGRAYVPQGQGDKAEPVITGRIVVASPPVHISHFGYSLCRTVSGRPWEWPEGHTQVSLADADKATCPDCIQIKGKAQKK
jgi:hypothetical protein